MIGFRRRAKMVAASTAAGALPTCTTCGAPVLLAFCAQCGTARPAAAVSAARADAQAMADAQGNSHTPAAAPALHEHHCRNCGELAEGSYCPHCGQETRVALPTAREFMREAAGRYVALDGRLFRTLFALLTRPGFLTTEYIAGRRVRYVRPGRLFLVTSLAALALIHLVADPTALIFPGDKGTVQAARDADKAQKASSTPTGTKGTPPPAAKGADAPPKDAKPAADGKDDKPGAGARDDDEDDGTIIKSDDLNLSLDRNLEVHLSGKNPIAAPLSDRIEHFNDLSNADKKQQLAENMFRYGPYAALMLLPAFALMLEGLYFFPSRRYPHRPRRFAAHMIFGAHNHAFLFVVAAIAAVTPGWLLPGWVLWIFAALYCLLAMRRVYGGGWVLLILRSGVLLVAYMVLFALVIAGLAVVAVLMH